MADQRTDKTELTSLNQLIQDIIGGSVRRHTFTQWELELLLDLQLCHVRKSARPELLRRYVKAVQLHYAQGATGPLRLASFLDRENDKSRIVALPKPETIHNETALEEELVEAQLAHARM